MATAVVYVLDRDQRPIECRTLIDTCSNANFMTEKLASKLRLPSKNQPIAIEALNQLNTITKRIVTTVIKSRVSNYQRNLTFFTITKISGFLPETQINRSRLSIPSNIKLADPRFHQPASIDMLIGTGPALSCLSIGQIDLSPHNDSDLILQKTQLGWIIGGNVSSIGPKPKHKGKTYVTHLNFELSKFWDLEEGTIKRHFSTEERECEAHFVKHVARNETGRYIIALPFKQNQDQLGESRSRALNRLFSLERKLERDPELMREYSAVIDEYLTLGHMQRVTNYDTHGFYLPHHAVVKLSSTTTKVRVVFDASAKSSSGLSLNDTQMVGPTIQDDIFSLLLRFRMHPYVLTGDIEKMYRQFLVRPKDQKYQRILWRDDKGEIGTFELKTVTFGLSSAPFLAIRCLHQLADDEMDNFPNAAIILKKDLYVDDLLTGANSIEEAIALRDEITQLLKRGGLNIRQWVSNEPSILIGLTKDKIHPKFFDDSSTVKTLGIYWNSQNDSITYTVNPQIEINLTKRTILSNIAKIFDPLGLLGPITITAKLLMHRLWQLKLDWDESLPENIYTEWTRYVDQLKILNNSIFNRFISQQNSQNVELHGFCDASERAYGACLYLRSINKHGIWKVALLCAKSRVAPLKTISLARLELCGAALLASLYVTVRDSLSNQIKRTIFWSDSTIVLSWLKKEPSTLKTFVANRVAEIQAKTETSTWRHIRSQDNPADILSRGQEPQIFIHNNTWRHGPSWLSDDESAWPISIITPIKDVPEVKRLSCFVTIPIDSNEIFNRFSCFDRLSRVIAYCLRFKKDYRNKGLLSVAEIQRATDRILQLVQSTTFQQDIDRLKSNSNHHRKSKLLNLNPFLDSKGLLRVGGRLTNSNLPFNQKHPILIPKGHHVSELIIRKTHLENHHPGVIGTLYAIRQNYWLIDGRNATRKIVRRCIRCFRSKPPNVDYVMGNLPNTRITENRPFQNCGIDYCGPFFIKERRRRNRARIKVYVAIFVCLSTKAVHLEVVSDMTTEAFIAAFKRFIARRGKCRNIYSDNGTNFVGADNEFKKLQETFPTNESVQRYLTNKEITWHFIPALSPHFGGLWEAAVKSFKHHVKRVIGNELFTFEQFNTFAIEIEAILNSRPLTPISSDANDLIALTPGHFLIGNSLTSLPESDFRSTPSNKLSKWQHIQKVKQDFWSRWHKEYINHLNIRHKWTKGSHNITEGTIVVLKDDHLPPLLWRLGRVEKVHPGNDGIVRAVTIRTANGGIYSRNVKLLAPLPIDN